MKLIVRWRVPSAAPAHRGPFALHIAEAGRQLAVGNAHKRRPAGSLNRFQLRIHRIPVGIPVNGF